MSLVHSKMIFKVFGSLTLYCIPFHQQEPSPAILTRVRRSDNEAGDSQVLALDGLSHPSRSANHGLSKTLKPSLVQSLVLIQRHLAFMEVAKFMPRADEEPIRPRVVQTWRHLAGLMTVVMTDS